MVAEMNKLFRPTPAQLAAANGKSVPDLLEPELKVLFCGINPGLYSAAVGHHFARPGNRFWPALHAGGFTPRIVSPFEERQLLPMGYGITNVVARATAAADELKPQEFLDGAAILERKILRYRPRFLAVLGIGAYRAAFGQPKASLGLQPVKIGDTAIWVLPNPSGLNAHYRASVLAEMFAELRKAVARNRGQ